ncbi:AraC family transcriptional regulator [Microbulbifer sp. OS29]|uniref:AraC family transcriptional regulator n=1 Tax=Microbulbifer okhotskensis TaxID=2926617 RepID=A0A9X2EJU0_9GAMM|nr:AraC family transcriptional regulator [Microbulbifer okhotskensis]MCO1333559.1 AraC family transcriptional regulator [Microbulbifer okhotskensis]
MKPIYEIRSGALAGFNILVPQLGGSPSGILAKMGLPADCTRRPNVLIPIATLTDLLNICSQKFACDDFGLRLADKQGLRMLGVLGKLILESKNLKIALMATHRYMVLHNQADHWKIQGSDGFWLAERVNHFPCSVAAEQYNELAMGAAYRLLRDMVGEEIVPRSVSFRHKQVSSQKTYRDFFGVEALFDQRRDCLIFEGTLMDHSLVKPGQGLIKYFDEFTRCLLGEHGGNIGRQVQVLILQTLGAQQHSLVQISRLLGMPARTLQRRLSEAGTSFKQLLQDARMETACWHLRASSIDIGLLSASLGYTDISAFSKAFRVMHGSSPLQWRKRQEARD